MENCTRIYNKNLNIFPRITRSKNELASEGIRQSVYTIQLYRNIEKRLWIHDNWSNIGKKVHKLAADICYMSCIEYERE